MSSKKITVPLAQSHTNECHITPKWFLDQSEYAPLTGSFRLLINGQEAFGEVYRAIAAAKKSVCIICWGFQPSMYFLRGDGGGLTIGQLLEEKGRQGVKVKVLSYVVDPLYLPLGITGYKPGEANTPGRRGVALKDKPPTHTDEQFHYDQEWYGRYDQDRTLLDAGAKMARGVWNLLPKTDNIKFVGRGFSPIDRGALANRKHEDKDIGGLPKAVLAATPSHHQKMVLVDYEDKERCIGFLMGHNMLDEYWDDSGHSYRRSLRPDGGRNGSRPRQDFSSRLTGPIVGDLFRNFFQAWQKETAESLTAADFSNYPAALDKQNTFVMGQILRTQPQHKREDIKNCYLQAVSNATQYIYIENQYFRWPSLADKIKACAAGQNCWGRKPETHGPLYLFVITNADAEGMGAGVRNTQRMLASLGKTDALPAVTRLDRADDAAARLGQTRQEAALLRQQQSDLAFAARQNPKGALAKQYNANQERLQVLEAQEKKQAAALKEAQDKDATIIPEERPGLKAHICTLVSPDTPGRSGQTATSGQDRALTREERIKEAKSQLADVEATVKTLLGKREILDSEARQLQGVPNAAANLTQRYENLNQQLGPAVARRDALQKELADLQDGSNPIDWVDVYIHAKLMLIDDSFMTLGSANINTRSMEVDSELNIAHHRPEVTRAARQTLWGMHTGHASGQEQMSVKGMEAAYYTWGEIMNENKKLRRLKVGPKAPLCEFYSGTTDRTDMD